MFIIKAIFWVMFLPFKLLFWWLPTEDDGNDEWQFWKEHGHDW